MKARVTQLFRNCTQPVDCILIKNASAPYVDDNFFYVTGLEQGLFEGSCALLHPDGSLDLLVSELEADSARKTTSYLSIYKTKDEFSALLKHLISTNRTIGVNAKGLSHHDYAMLSEVLPQATLVDVSEACQTTRLIKDDQEISHLKHACAIADDTIASVPDIVTEEMTEYELAAELNYSLQSFGAEKPAFDTISSFGKNTAEPHYSHGETKLQKGDIVLCDLGAHYRKYNSDITRTFIFNKATDQQKNMYEVVRHAQQLAFDMIQPGVKAYDVHQAVSAYIDSTVFKGKFIHSTGHSLGLAVHDGPGFTVDNTMLLQENMVLTVEPGVYLPGLGGVRLEDDILIKKDGMELLTKSPREFLELE